MSGVFLSYSRSDRQLADQIIRGLRAIGVVVWWDEDMPGVDWQQELERQIKELSAVIVLWTDNSASSNNVRDEARLGLHTNKLVNAMARVTSPPFPFDRVNGLPLDGWTGRQPHKGWTRLVQTIESLVVRAGGAEAGDITGALARREGEMRKKQQAVAEAQDAFQSAQERDGEASAAAKIAADLFDRSEKQFQLVVEMRATPAVVRTAQGELDVARDARDTADRTRRTTKAELSEASRSLARARVVLEAMFTEAVESPIGSVSAAAVAPQRVLDQAAPVSAASHALKPDPTPEQESTPTAPSAIDQAAAAPLGQNRSRRGPEARWLLIASGVAVVVAIGASTVFTRAGRPPAPASASPDPSTLAVRAADALAGNWAPTGLTCDNAITIAVRGGQLALTASGVTTYATIEPSPQPNVVDTQAANGAYTYTIAQDNTLSMGGPGGLHLRMTRCAG